MTKAAPIAKISGPGIREYPLTAWDLLVGSRHPIHPPRAHLDATMSWLCRAQDAGDDGGVARMYHVRNGWGASYPETTGYIVPTFLDYARLAGDDEFKARALRMAHWECDVQMPTGAVQAGVVTEAPRPAIFNTGQVLFGWCAAYRQCGEERFRQAGVRAADFLCEAQDADGGWRRSVSPFTQAAAGSVRAYNVRSSWALAIAASVLEARSYRDAALANVKHVCGLARSNGWIESNCLNRPEQPLLHTIAYAYQGLLESSVLLKDEEALDVTIRGNEHLRDKFTELGRLHGRYDESWRPTVRWRCLTGEAQTAVVWFRLAEVTQSTEWSDAARRLLEQLKRTHSLRGDPATRGGIKGSHPITGAYGRLEYLNWAAKFFADALMLELGISTASTSG